MAASSKIFYVTHCGVEDIRGTMGDMADYLIDQMWDGGYWESEWDEESYYPPSPSRHAGDSCPKGCGGTLIVKYNRTTGEPFLGCSSFPGCKGY